MFRIKTDIRQYKCETKDKVEKLIRNWVIRPSDLIYNRDEREWLPIGEHPSFVGLFGMLAEQEKNTPDTVVTARSPYADRPPPQDDEDDDASETETPSDEPAEDEEASEAEDDLDENDSEDLDEDEEESAEEENEDEAGEDSREEVTHIVERPAFDDDRKAEDGDDEEPPPEPVEDEGAERETDEVDAASRAEADRKNDERETNVFEQEDIAETMGAKPKPPEPPEGVEPPSNDEVTMMTEKTLEMLKVEDEEEDEDASPPELPEGEEVGDEESGEATNVVPSPLEEGEDDEEEAEQESSAEEADEEAETSGTDSDEDDDEQAEADESSADDSAKAADGPRLGRHDLPEELFATNEISSPEVQESLKRIDDLGELSEPSTPVDESAEDGTTPKWGSKLAEDSGVDEAWDVIASDLGPGSEVEEDAELRTTDELDRDDEDDDDIPEVEIEEWDEEEWEEEGWDGDTPEPAVVQDREFVSEGYRIPLPFPMRPTPEDVERGLKRTKVARARRERTFPTPVPKKTYEIHRRSFNLTPRPPRDQTAILLVGVLIVITLMVALVASC